MEVDMKGFKTVLFGGLIAIAAPLIEYLEGIKSTIGQCDVTTDVLGNVQEFCSLPWWVGSIIGVMIIGLRFITSTPIFKK